jgi:hypothetical protein
MSLPRVTLALGLLALFVVAMGVMFLERDRPLRVFRAQVAKVADGQAEELDLPKLIRQHRLIGEQMQRAIETMVLKGGGARAKPKANLDEILGPAPESLTSSAFSFGEDKAEGSGAFRPAVMAPPVAPMRAPAPPATPDAAQHVKPVVPPPPPAPAQSSASGERKAAVLADTLPNNSNAMPVSAEEEAHFQEVFAKFLELRKECGENSSDLTYERMLGTLQKSRPDAKGVRFTVYAKEGKAALKAAPRKA